MATVGVGIDVVDVARFALALERRPQLKNRLFTSQELRDAAEQVPRLAARFAAKEAVLKSLAVGLGATAWTSIEVMRADSGAPSIALHGTALALANARGIDGWHLSLSHVGSIATAMCVATRGDH